ncbi:STAS domain-containing protein [Streptomyces sp. NPDC055055]
MSVEHSAEGRLLALSLPADLDITHRAAAIQQVQRLLFSYRPLGVRLHLSAGPASSASLSVLARVHRLCEGLGITLALTGRPWPVPGPTRGDGSPRRGPGPGRDTRGVLMTHNDSSPQGDVLHVCAAGGHIYSAPGGAGVYRRTTRFDGIAQLEAAGEFDVDSVGCLRQALSDAAAEDATCVQLDVSAVTFGDSSFLHVLVRARNDTDRLVLIGPVPHQLSRLFHLTGTTRLFHFAA